MKHADFPKIFEVPFYFPQSLTQKVTFTYRVEPGDECIVLMFEQALDQWRTGVESSTELKFDLQNAVAIPGLFAKPNPLVKRAHDNESIIIQRGYGGDPEETFIELYDGKMEMQVQYSENGIDTYHLMVDGREDRLDFTVKDTGGGETLTLGIDGNAGKVDLWTKDDINVETVKNLNVKTGENITVEAAQNITVKAAQNIEVTANANMNIKSTGPMVIESGASITLKAPRIDLNP